MIFSNKKDINHLITFLDNFESYLQNNTNNLEIPKEEETKKLKVIENKILNIAGYIKAQKTQDIKVFGEVMIVCEKLSDGFTNDSITEISSDEKINYISKTINNMSNKLDTSLKEVTKRLKDYEEQNYLESINEDLFRGGELKNLLVGINSLKDKVTDNLIKNYRQGLVLKEESELLKEESKKLADSTMIQASTIEETAASIEEITATISQNRITANEMSVLGEQVKESAKSGINLVSETRESMDEISSATKEAVEAIGIISQIAFQTNILSLNAAVEAATAGEAGKGFAVVAGEVRNLANKSADAAKQIEELMTNLTKKTVEGLSTSKKMFNEYNVLNENITNTIDLISKVENSSKEQELGIKQINDAVSQIDTFTQENAQIADNVRHTSTQSNNIATQVVETISQAQFIGKEKVKIRKKTSSNQNDFNGKDRRFDF